MECVERQRAGVLVDPADPSRLTDTRPQAVVHSSLLRLTDDER